MTNWRSSPDSLRRERHDVRTLALFSLYAIARSRTGPPVPSSTYVLLHIGKTGSTYVQHLLSRMGCPDDIVIAVLHQF